MTGYIYADCGCNVTSHAEGECKRPARAKFTTDDRTVPVFVALGYDKLFQVLNGALHQAQTGKGNERHSRGEAFHDQPILTITRRRGIGFTLGQVEKKVDEADGMISRGERGAAVRELLGAINYLAATIIYLDEQSDHADSD